MKKGLMLSLAVLLALWAYPVLAAEHGGTQAQEEGAKEHGGTEAAVPSSDDIRAAMQNHVMDQAKATGTFDVIDPETGNTRKLALEKVHERVGKTGSYYYSCADFKDTESGEMLDLDLDVEDENGVLTVADVRIHKVNGKERYTYDENDNRIPLEGGAIMEGKDMMMEEMPKEHGGEGMPKEHGGT